MFNKLTEWRNHDGFFVVRCAKVIVAEGAYAGLAVIGAVEAVVRIALGVIFFVFSPVELILRIPLKERIWFRLEVAGFLSLSASLASINHLLENILVAPDLGTI